MSACPRCYFLEGPPKEVNIQLCCHSTCIRPSSSRAALAPLPSLYFPHPAIAVRAPRPAPLLSEAVAEAVSWLALVLLTAAPGYGEGGVFRELQDPPWLLPAVP